MNDQSIKLAHWASREPDEKFETIRELTDTAYARKSASTVVTLPASTITVKPSDGRLIVLLDDVQARPTDWAISQVAAYAGAPASYIRTLTPTLAADCLNYGLQRSKVDATALIERGSGGATLRTLTSPSYGRIWDADVGAEIAEAVARNGRVEPVALSLSDRSFFAFFAEKEPSAFRGTKDELKIGFVAWNSEVGSRSFGITSFLFRSYCSNRTIFGAKDVQQVRIRHNARAADRFAIQASRVLQVVGSQEVAREVEHHVEAAKLTNLGPEPEDVRAFFKRNGITQWEAKAAEKAALEEEGQFRTAWDAVNGLTAVARGIEHEDRRADLEERAGKILVLA